MNNVFDAVVSNVVINIERRNLDVAQEEIEKCIKSRPKSSKAHFLLGETLRNKAVKDKTVLDKAVASYKKAIYLEPNYAPSYREIGLIYRNADKKFESRGYLTHYLAISPDAADANIIKLYLDTIKEE
jgi:tetratricopeptide (TPR) repeat protein